MTRCEDHPLDISIHEDTLTRHIRAHGLLITLATASTIVACSFSFYLIYRHVTNYTQPKLQKLTIRILFMVPVYTIACVLSIPFYKEHVYIAAVYEFYESLVIASFFLLLCRYLHWDLHTLRRGFSLVEPKPWLHPVRFLRHVVWRKKTGRTYDGLKWFSIIWAGVFQFCIVKFLGALTKCITESLDIYCRESNSVHHVKIWVWIIEIASLVTAMFCLLQFYKQTMLDLAPHRPLLKFLAIKLVIFLFYVQTFIFNQLTKEGGAIKPTHLISYPSLAIGIPNTVLCVEMAAISVLHLWAYPYDVYRVDKPRLEGRGGCYTYEDRRNTNTDEIDLTRRYTQPTALNKMAWSEAIIHTLSFKDVWRGLVQGFHGLTEHRRRNMIGQHTIAEVEGHVEQLKTTKLSEALELIHQSSRQRD